MVSTGQGARLTKSWAESDLGRCAAVIGSSSRTDITLMSTPAFAAKSRMESVAGPNPLSKRIRLCRSEYSGTWSLIQCWKGSVNSSAVFADVGISSLTFITVNVAPYRSANETTYSAALLVSGKNSRGYRIAEARPWQGLVQFSAPPSELGKAPFERLLLLSSRVTTS